MSEDRPERVIRTGRLTAEEAAREREIRRNVQQEFPPARPSLHSDSDSQVVEKRLQYRLRTLFLATGAAALFLGVIMQCGYYYAVTLALLAGICLALSRCRVAGIALIVGAALGFLWLRGKAFQDRGVSNPAADFYRTTALDWPDSADVLSWSDTFIENTSVVWWFGPKVS